MKYLLIFISFIFILQSEDESFITQKEYGKQLYNNPRGIGCNKCHGNAGKGMTIANYESNNGEKKEIFAPDITSLDYKTFEDSLHKDSKTMPTYYLTNSEIEAIYDYIHIAN